MACGYICGISLVKFDQLFVPQRKIRIIKKVLKKKLGDVWLEKDLKSVQYG
mgnify:CR=1 FL=1